MDTAHLPTIEFKYSDLDWIFSVDKVFCCGYKLSIKKYYYIRQVCCNKH